MRVLLLAALLLLLPVFIYMIRLRGGARRAARARAVAQRQALDAEAAALRTPEGIRAAGANPPPRPRPRPERPLPAGVAPARGCIVSHTPPPAVTRAALPLPLFLRGKVRDTFDLGDRLLIVATDRLSAFDCVLPDRHPRPGRHADARCRPSGSRTPAI